MLLARIAGPSRRVESVHSRSNRTSGCDGAQTCTTELQSFQPDSFAREKAAAQAAKAGRQLHGPMTVYHECIAGISTHANETQGSTPLSHATTSTTSSSLLTRTDAFDSFGRPAARLQPEEILTMDLKKIEPPETPRGIQRNSGKTVCEAFARAGIEPREVVAGALYPAKKKFEGVCPECRANVSGVTVRMLRAGNRNCLCTAYSLHGIDPHTSPPAQIARRIDALGIVREAGLKAFSSTFFEAMGRERLHAVIACSDKMKVVRKHKTKLLSKEDLLAHPKGPARRGLTGHLPPARSACHPHPCATGLGLDPAGFLQGAHADIAAQQACERKQQGAAGR